jgi:hypothetical protein
MKLMAGNGKNKRKSAGTKQRLMSNNPLTIRFSEAEGRLLKLKPWKALADFDEKKGNLDRWTTLSFRTQVSLLLAEEYVKQAEAAIQLKTSLNVLMAIFERCHVSRVWEMTEEELSEIRPALELADQLQDICTRKEMLIAYKRTKVIMDKHEDNYRKKNS